MYTINYILNIIIIYINVFYEFWFGINVLVFVFFFYDFRNIVYVGFVDGY